MINNGVIQHEMKPNWSILEVTYRLEGGYLLLQMFLGRAELR